MIQTGAASYEELLNSFNEALNNALSGTAPPPSCADMSPTLSLSLVDIACAARDKRPTQNLVTLACAAFTLYAADRDGRCQRSPSAAAVDMRRRRVRRSVSQTGLSLSA